MESKDVGEFFFYCRRLFNWGRLGFVEKILFDVSTAIDTSMNK